MASGIGAMFSEALATGVMSVHKLVKQVLVSLIDVLQGMLIAAVAAAAAKSILFLGLTIPTDTAAILGITAGLQLLRAFVASMHSGVSLFYDAPADREAPILIRGGETVRVTTPEQEERTGGGVTINFNAPVDNTRYVLRAIKKALRESNVSVDKLLVSNRHKVSIS